MRGVDQNGGSARPVPTYDVDKIVEKYQKANDAKKVTTKKGGNAFDL